MLNRLIDLEVRYTYRFLDATGNKALTDGTRSPMLIHMLSSAFYSGLFETVRHEMPKEEAQTYVHRLRRFFICGWADLLGIKPE